MAGVPPKVISERLGHATAAFTLQTYEHVVPGMDEDAASSVADLILGGLSVPVRTEAIEAPKMNWPGTSPRPAMVAGAGFEPATSGL